MNRMAPGGDRLLVLPTGSNANERRPSQWKRCLELFESPQPGSRPEESVQRRLMGVSQLFLSLGLWCKPEVMTDLHQKTLGGCFTSMEGSLDHMRSCHNVDKDLLLSFYGPEDEHESE
ncbi:uncharacterized protein V6R79_001551 [Siganus canaliculatus]